MNKIIPFSISSAMFIITWCILLNFDHIKNKSVNLAVAYATVSLIISVFIFVILATIYKYENMHLNDECIKNEFIMF